MSPVVLDTDVASRILRDRLSPALAVKLIGKTPVITFVTLGELTTWVSMRQWGPARISGDAIAATWGLITANATRLGRTRPQNDSWIATCCLANGFSLATFNVKDFDHFAEHEGLELITA